MIDPTTLPANNNYKAAPFELLSQAFPNMSWHQPRNNRRAMYMSQNYMTLPFAEELGALMGCTAERARLPPAQFLEEAKKPPPLDFETDDRVLQGVCCVCYKKGCLGRCPNQVVGYLCTTPVLHLRRQEQVSSVLSAEMKEDLLNCRAKRRREPKMSPRRNYPFGMKLK